MASQKTTSMMIVRNIFDAALAQSRQIFIIFALLFGATMLFFAYRWWAISREQAAQYDFSMLIDEFETMSHEKDPEWAVLLKKFESNYQKHSRSSLLPYYQNYKVQILLQQGDTDAALSTLDQLIDDMQSSPYVSLYSMERALIQLSNTDSTVIDTGLQTLKNLAEDTTNIFRDSAQFYLGRYYWTTHQIDSARAVWQKLVDEQRDEKIAPSPWVAQVQESLQLMIVE